MATSGWAGRIGDTPFHTLDDSAESIEGSHLAEKTVRKDSRPSLQINAREAVGILLTSTDRLAGTQTWSASDALRQALHIRIEEATGGTRYTAFTFRLRSNYSFQGTRFLRQTTRIDGSRDPKATQNVGDRTPKENRYQKTACLSHLLCVATASRSTVMS